MFCCTSTKYVATQEIRVVHALPHKHELYLLKLKKDIQRFNFNESKLCKFKRVKRERKFVELPKKLKKKPLIVRLEQRIHKWVMKD